MHNYKIKEKIGMLKELLAEVSGNIEIAPGVFEISLKLPEAVQVKSGQFLNLSVGDGGHLLRRPFAIMCYNKELQTAVCCYQVKGEGTQMLSRVKLGDKLSCALPLGNGFTITGDQKRVALIGGGVGVFPMLSVLYEYYESDKNFRAYMGFRSAAYANMFGQYDHRSDCYVCATDDGSFGAKGNAVQLFFDDYENAKPDVILSCGPTPMLRALKAGLKERGIKVPCYVSLEEHMGCGIGACLVCVCKKSGKEENVRVCKDGPVFGINEVEI